MSVRVVRKWLTVPMEEPVKFAPRPTGAGEMFQLLRDGRPRTRAELGALTGQSRSTIAARIDALTAIGLLGATGEQAASTGGRPPATFVFLAGAHVVLAVDLGATHARLALTDLASRVLLEHHEALAISAGPEKVLQRVAELGAELLTRVGRSRGDLIACGVGLPGPVEHETGRPTNPPIMPGWDDWDVRASLEEAFGVPVAVDNDVNIMALGEHRFAMPQERDLLFVKVATGIGAGLIAGDALLRGAQGAAGDIGHIALADSQEPCRCGNVGCLEAVAGGAALVHRLREAGFDVETSSDVTELVRRGNTEAAHAVRQAGRALGTVLAGCVSLLNPSVIVVGGVIAEAGEYLLAGAREVVYARSLPLATAHLRLVGSRTGARAGVLGASALAVDQVLSPAAIDARIPS